VVFLGEEFYPALRVKQDFFWIGAGVLRFIGRHNDFDCGPWLAAPGLTEAKDK
jgi:hypothetical protein